MSIDTQTIIKEYQKDASKTNQILEKQILKNPEQYLWIHRRFKTSPEGEENFYSEN